MALRSPGRSLLLVLSVAVAMSAATTCYVLSRNTLDRMAADVGLGEHSLVGVSVVPYGPDRWASRTPERLEAELATTRGTPGVVRVSTLAWPLFERFIEFYPVATVDGRFATLARQGLGPGGLETLGVRLVAGRPFDPDPAAAEALVSEETARRLFGGEALGRPLPRRFGDRHDTVVGVYSGARIVPAFFPDPDVSALVAAAPPDSGPLHLIARVDGDAGTVAEAIAVRLRSLGGPRLVVSHPVAEVRRWGESVARVMSFLLLLVLAFVAVALAIGVGGMVSLAVTQRTRQLGVQRALGATRGDIIGQVLVETGVLSSFGVALGAPLTYGIDLVIRLRQSEQPLPLVDASLVGTAATLFFALGTLSALGAALRAARLDPVVATQSR